jgi:hypothetical protein
MPTVRKWFGHDGLSAGIFFLGGLLEGVVGRLRVGQKGGCSEFVESDSHLIFL